MQFSAQVGDVALFKLREQFGGHRIPEYGLRVEAPLTLADEPGGDHLDALLCAIQAGWAWTQRKFGFGGPRSPDPLEGWSADPIVAVARKHNPNAQTRI